MDDFNFLGLGEMRNRLAVWADGLDWTSVLWALAFLAVVVIFRARLAQWLTGWFQKFLARNKLEVTENVLNELQIAVRLLLVIFALYIVLETLNPPTLPGDFLRRILASGAIIAVFSTWYNLCGPLVSILKAGGPADVTLEAGWMERVAQFAVVIIGVTAVLKVWDVDISSALTGVGVLGAGVAIAAQDLVRNLIAGMNNLSEKRFSVGDAIQVDGVLAGTVEKIDLRSTLVRGFDQIPRYVPNFELSNAVVLNYSHSLHRRVMWTIPLVLSATEEQVLQVRDALRDHIANSGNFDTSPEASQYVHVNGLSDSAIEIFVLAATKGPTYAGLLETREALTLTLLDAVEKAGTELAYPTQTIEFSGPLPPSS